MSKIRIQDKHPGSATLVLSKEISSIRKCTYFEGGGEELTGFIIWLAGYNYK
jgi:hypothetical protein